MLRFIFLSIDNHIYHFNVKGKKQFMMIVRSVPPCLDFLKGCDTADLTLNNKKHFTNRNDYDLI